MKNVLITGGSRGIGAECVRSFCDLGCNVYFFYKKSDAEAKKLMEKTNAVGIKCDISNCDDIKRAADIVKQACSIDILINNAAVSQIKVFQDITESDYDEMFNTNMKGAFMVTKEFIGGMINKKYGRIINISSMWGETGGSCEVHYSASKAALIGFTKALAKEVGPSGITVNCITPGVINTDMNAHLTEEDKQELADETPVMRLGNPSEVVRAVMYFAGEDSGFTTGTVLAVNGGIIM